MPPWNYRSKQECPLEGKCYERDIVYKCAVNTKVNHDKAYVITPGGVSKNYFATIERLSKTVGTQIMSPLKNKSGRRKVNKMKYELQNGRLGKIYQATQLLPKIVYCASMKSSNYSATAVYTNI